MPPITVGPRIATQAPSQTTPVTSPTTPQPDATVAAVEVTPQQPAQWRQPATDATAVTSDGFTTTSTTGPRPLSTVLTQLDGVRFTAEEQALLKKSAADGSALPAPLAAKREGVLALENDGLTAALAVATKSGKSDVLDAQLDRLAAAVKATGVETKPNESLHRLVTKVDGEQWTVSGEIKQSLVASLLRGQGVATDDKGNWFFSGNDSLQKVRDADSVLGTTQLGAIPESLKALGANHIGDLDVAGDTLYAPIEDGPKYENPTIGIFDAKTLAFQRALPLSKAALPDGVPWVAFDTQGNRLLTSVYKSATQLHAVALNGAPLPPIELSQPVERVQGATIRNGMAYLTCDDAQKSIYKVNLRTGTVMPVAKLGEGAREIEGVAFHTNGAEVELSALSIENNRRNALHKLRDSRVSLFSFRLSTPPKRAAVVAPAR